MGLRVSGRGIGAWVSSHRWSALGICAIVIAISAAVAHFGPRVFYRFFGYLHLKQVQASLPRDLPRVVASYLGGAELWVVWSSSRSGNHEIYLRKLPSMETYRLTDDPHVDYYPRFSPDGRRVLFARSRRKWVSQRDELPWDCYIVELDSGRERLVAEWANFPMWVDEGRVSFVRRRQEIVLKEIDTGTEHVLLKGGDWPGSAIATFEILRTRPWMVAINGDGAFAGVNTLNLRTRRRMHFGSGCQIFWFPDGKKVYWVEARGRGGTRVMCSPAEKIAPRVLLDMPGEFSHEYFPRVSADGKWMVLGASTGGHEHDIADYEIFLWRVGSPPSSALRITFSPANDRWPDLYLPSSR